MSRNRTDRQNSLIELVQTHKDSNLPFEILLSDKELKILNLFLEGNAYSSIAEEIETSNQRVSQLLITSKDSIYAKLSRNWNREQRRIKQPDEEEVLQELKQCDRESLNAALSKLGFSQLKLLYSVVKNSETKN